MDSWYVSRSQDRCIYIYAMGEKAMYLVLLPIELKKNKDQENLWY